MPVFGGRLHGVHADFGKVRIRSQGQRPFDVVVEATRAGQVGQRQLILKAVHVAVTQRTGQLAKLVGGTLLGHHAAAADGVAGLVDAQLVLAERHRAAQTFSVAFAHDGLARHRVDEVERDLVAGTLGEVHATHDRQIRTGLLAQVGFSVGLLGQLAGEAVERRIALHVRSEQAGGLNLQRLRATVGEDCLTHDGSPFEDCLASQRCVFLLLPRPVDPVAP